MYLFSGISYLLDILKTWLQIISTNILLRRIIVIFLPMVKKTILLIVQSLGFEFHSAP